MLLHIAVIEYGDDVPDVAVADTPEGVRRAVVKLLQERAGTVTVAFDHEFTEFLQGHPFPALTDAPAVERWLKEAALLPMLPWVSYYEFTEPQIDLIDSWQRVGGLSNATGTDP